MHGEPAKCWLKLLCEHSGHRRRLRKALPILDMPAKPYSPHLRPVSRPRHHAAGMVRAAGPTKAGGLSGLIGSGRTGNPDCTCWVSRVFYGLVNTIRLGPARLIWPSNEVEAFIRKQAQEHLLSRFPVGTFKTPETVNSILQHQFAFYDAHLRQLVGRVASRDAAQFVLFQYDEAAKILHNAHLNEAEAEQWSEVEGTFRRGVKYITELMCLERPGDIPAVPKGFAGSTMELVFALAENAVRLAEMSNRVFHMYPEQWYVIVGRPQDRYDFTLRISGPDETFDAQFQTRVIRDRRSRDRYVPMPQFDMHTITHQKYLDTAFKSSFGMSYGEFIFMITQTIEGAQPAPDGCPTLFIHEKKLLAELGKSGMPPEAIDTAIRGFSVRAEHLEQEKRVLYRPKQSSRAYRRGFFVMPHKEGPHLAFSKSMAQECMAMLANSVCYQYLPSEWQTPDTKNALSSLSGAAGKWFENIVTNNMGSLGIAGGRIKGTLGKDTQRISVPESVGEMDFLGYSPSEKAIVLAEAKMTSSGLEAAIWRDDVYEFVTSKKSFALKFRRKIAWVRENLAAVAGAMGCPVPERFHFVMLTLYPCIAAPMIKDFKCVSVAEFRLDYDQASGWPY